VNVEAHDVEVTIGHRRILWDASLVCRPGQMTALVGPSGCGKTTMLHCLGLLQPPSAGRIIVDGVDATAWTSARRRRFWREDCAFVLQDYGLIDEESVEYNVSMTATLFRGRVAGDRHKVRDVLGRTGLSGREAEPALHLSGGEKQRLAIARALYKDARVILVDEPTASLDSANRSRLIDLLDSLRRHGATVIVATHDENLIDATQMQYPIVRQPDGAQDGRNAVDAADTRHRDHEGSSRL
jgi:putative ABC transport system ATP-binding protein